MEVHGAEPPLQVRVVGCPVGSRQIGEAKHSEADHDATFHREPLVGLRELSLKLGRAAERDDLRLTFGRLRRLLVLHEVHDR